MNPVSGTETEARVRPQVEGGAPARTLTNYVGGRWQAAAATDTLDDIDPATAELAALVPLSGAADVNAAVGAARAAQLGWRAVAPHRRALAVMALRKALWARREGASHLDAALE